MADSRGHGRSSGHPPPAVADDQNLNDLNYGHLGRLTYIRSPDVDGEQPGLIHTTRSTDSAPYFQQITPFDILAPPVLVSPRPRSSGPQLQPWRTARSQKNWLLSHHPEAACGNWDLIPSLSREIRTQSSVVQPQCPTSPLFALGEVADRSRQTASASQPAIAFAAGEVGQILRISTLTRDERRWDDDKLAVHASTTSSGEKGEWEGDGLSISLVKFAVSAKTQNYIRWILVQKETSTTLLEPEVRKRPIKKRHLNPNESRGTFEISPNPLLTITSDKTGGGSQSDVSFNPSAYGEPPQLAIIDTHGNWSIWDITKTHLALAQPVAVLRTCGNIDVGIIPTISAFPSQSRRGPEVTHRILWVSQPDEALSVWTREGSYSDQSSKYSQDQDQPGRPTSLLNRFGHIFLCSNTTIYSFDLLRRKFQTGLTIANANRGERILDVQTCPFDVSQVFVLTTSALIWVGHELSPTGDLRLATMISSHHHHQHRKDGKGMPRLSVSPNSGFWHSAACFVCVYSPSDVRVTAFWFTKPSQEMPPQACFRHIVLDGSPDLNSIMISPLPSLYTELDAVAANGRPSILREARLFQLFVQGSDLSLGRACIAWLPRPPDGILPPRAVPAPRPRLDPRRGLIHHLQDSFVVPDDLEDDGGPAAKTVKNRPDTAQSAKARRPANKTADFSLLSDRLRRSVDARLQELGTASPSEAPFSAIREAVEQDIAEGQPAVHFLSEIARLPGAPTNFDSLKQEWMAQVDDLQAIGDVDIIERQAYGFQPGIRRLGDSIGEQALLPAGAPREFYEKQQRVLDGTAADVYASLCGISVTPRPLGLLDMEDVKAEPEPGLEPDSSQPGTPWRGASTPTDFSTVFRSGRQRSALPGLESAQTQDGGDGAVARLRRYLPTLTEPESQKAGGGRLRLLSNWPEQPGSDPSGYVWMTEEKQREDEQRRQKMQEEDARRQRAERRRAALFPSRPSAQPQSSQPGAFSSSQPREVFSQSSAPVFSSQVMSQVTPGLFGSRTPSARKKAKGKHKERPEGFR